MMPMLKEKKKTKDWNQPVETLSGIGKSTSRYLQKLEIETIKDLLFHFPRRYLDTAKVNKIAQVKINEVNTVVGTVKKISKRMFSGRRSLVEVVIGDNTGYISGTFFNQPYTTKNFEEGDYIAFAGKIEHKYGKFQINNPLYDKLDKGRPLHTMGILPFHSTTAGISTKQIRSLVKKVLDYIPDKEMLPSEVINEERLASFKKSIKNVHFPSDFRSLKQAKDRLIFQEFFELQLAVLIKKQRIKNIDAHLLKPGNLIEAALDKLPFSLTGDQKKVLAEITEDTLSQRPMNRLLQGEVGSGKTIVAFLSALRAIENGFQASIMAPTEILAKQHFERIKPLANKLKIVVALLVSSLKEDEKKETLNLIENGKAKLIIGTHALIQEGVSFKNVALVVVDEQHRFGVEQRKSLNKKGTAPHTLVMTATPIPRSLALTLYGDLDVSTIKELPSGKDFTQKVNTVVCQGKKREQAYEKIREEVRKGRQAFVICPLIDLSDKIEAKAVEEEIENLKENVFREFKVDSIHGKLKTNEKENIMLSFNKGEIDILLATTLIEVGVDVPNVTVMIIENADRFGLAQLHQLRGRVGRGEHDGVCIMMPTYKTEDSIKRMRAIRELKDGFSLAEADLTIRGEGRIFGFNQAGFSDLKIASLQRDFEV
ncbi:MAG: ATP-dependent DNA helicase RecG, partial [Actinobacteria bacterium]